MNNIIIIQGCHSGPEWKVELITKTAFICFEWNLLRLHPILTLITNQSASFFLMGHISFSFPFMLPWWSLSTPFLPLLYLLLLKLTLAKWVVHGQLWHFLLRRNLHGQSQISSAWQMKKINSDQFSSSIHWASFAQTNEAIICGTNISYTYNSSTLLIVPNMWAKALVMFWPLIWAKKSCQYHSYIIKP